MPRVVSDEKKQAIRERRWKVWRLRVVQKLDISEIVSAMGVCAATVETDLAAMRKVRSEHVQASRRAQEAAVQAGIEVIEECDAACRQAWSDLLAADPGSATRAKFLGVLLVAVARRVEILQSLGLLDRAAEEVVVHDASDIRDLTDEEATQLLTLLRSGRARKSASARQKAARRAGRRTAADAG